MKIVVGLGNPGKNYEKTKHNVGFQIIEQLARANQFPAFSLHTKFNAEVSKKDDILLVKPHTYMNRSGQSVRAITTMYKDKLAVTQPRSLKELLVIHDDLDLELGNYKIQFGTGPKIHNGLLSLYEQLGTHDFWHVRVGVDTRQGDRTIPADRYVLMPFTDDEESIWEKIKQEVTAKVSTMLV